MQTIVRSLPLAKNAVHSPASIYAVGIVAIKWHEVWQKMSFYKIVECITINTTIL